MEMNLNGNSNLEAYILETAKAVIVHNANFRRKVRSKCPKSVALENRKCIDMEIRFSYY